MHSPPPPLKPGAAPSASTKMHVVLAYVGFRNAPDRREYVLRAQSGSQAREYTVWIPHRAFARRQALFQDGPDICYQKLRRELAASELGGLACVGVTEGDLANYRDTHSPIRRGVPGPSPRPRREA